MRHHYVLSSPLAPADYDHLVKIVGVGQVGHRLTYAFWFSSHADPFKNAALATEAGMWTNVNGLSTQVPSKPSVPSGSVYRTTSHVAAGVSPWSDVAVWPSGILSLGNGTVRHFPSDSFSVWSRVASLISCIGFILFTIDYFIAGLW